MSALERLAILLISLALAVGLIAVLSGYFAGNDQGNVTGEATVPGQRIADQGDQVLRPGQLRPPYASDPPTSGPHIPATVHRDGVSLSDDQLLSAIAQGNVVFVYGPRRFRRALHALALAVAGRFSPALAAAGQAIIVSPQRSRAGVVALAWDHLLRVASPDDPRLRQFASFWLGRVRLSPG